MARQPSRGELKVGCCRGSAHSDMVACEGSRRVVWVATRVPRPRRAARPPHLVQLGAGLGGEGAGVGKEGEAARGGLVAQVTHKHGVVATSAPRRLSSHARSARSVKRQASVMPLLLRCWRRRSSFCCMVAPAQVAGCTTMGSAGTAGRSVHKVSKASGSAT